MIEILHNIKGVKKMNLAVRLMEELDAVQVLYNGGLGKLQS